jgi:uncharacterized protein
MAARNIRTAIALALIAGSASFAEPAAAQFRDFFHFPWGGGSQSYPNYPSYPSRSYNPFYPRPQVYEPTKPPPPRKLETPPSETVVVLGDTVGEWLAYGLEEVFADTPDVGIVRRIKPNSGLVRYESAKGDIQDWSEAIEDLLLTDKPAAIVVMLGVNDRLPLRERSAPAKAAAQGATSASAPPETPPADSERPSIAAPESARRSPNGWYEFRSDRWAELYDKRIDDMIAALKKKGVPVLWVGLPAVRGTKSTSDMSYLDELYRARAEKGGIPYVDIWDGFVDERGVFALQGPDFEGQIRRLRTGDGVHFTKAGAEKLAHYVEHDLRRILTNRVAPVALPGPEEQPVGKGNARPAIGPVVPLGAVGGEGGDLLGATSHPAQHESDPVATRVLSRGDAIAAPPGRADNFAWPRADANLNGAADIAPVAVTPPAGAAPPAKGAGAKTDAKKAAEASNDKKKQPVATGAPARSPRTPNGAPPRPPLPIGPGGVNDRGGY